MVGHGCRPRQHVWVTRHIVVRPERMRGRGAAKPQFGSIPAVLAGLGVIGPALGTSEDMPEGTDTPFGVSGASFGRGDSSQGR